jgi:hypothetical protein
MTTSSAASDEDKAMELIGMIIGAQPHWKFIEKSLIAALKHERESLPESILNELEGMGCRLSVIKELLAWQRGDQAAEE